VVSFMSLTLFFTGSTASLGPGLWFFSFMIILQTVGLLGRVISLSQGLYLNTGQDKHRINTYTYQTSMPCMVFEPTNLASEWLPWPAYEHLDASPRGKSPQCPLDSRLDRPPESVWTTWRRVKSYTDENQSWVVQSMHFKFLSCFWTTLNVPSGL
jgi:hypothetical protein